MGGALRAPPASPQRTSQIFELVIPALAKVSEIIVNGFSEALELLDVLGLLEALLSSSA